MRFGRLEFGRINKDAPGGTPGDPPAPTYDADAQAYFDAFSVDPVDARKDLIETFFLGLKSDGLFAKFSGGWISFAGADAQGNRVNLIDPSQMLSAIGGPDWTADRGYLGDGGTSYLDSFVAANTIFGATSGTKGYWMNIYPAAANSDVMGTSNANCRIRLGTTGGGHARAYETANVNVSTSPHKTVVRKGAGQVTTYDNGAVTTVGTGLTDTTPGAETITFLKGPTYSATRMAAGYFTPAILTDTDVANMHSRLNAYLSEIGAA